MRSRTLTRLRPGSHGWARVGDRARDSGDTEGRSAYYHFMYGFPERDLNEEGDQ
jgi:hypothetical protein